MKSKWLARMNKNFAPSLSQYIGKPFTYLEIGVFRGATTKWVLENIATNDQSMLFGIDPWERSMYRKHDIPSEADWKMLLDGIEQIEKEANGKVQFIKGYSYEILKDPRWLPNFFDAVYIDGEHTDKAVKQDFLLSWPLLKIGGVMIFDDYLMRGNPQMKDAIDCILSAMADNYALLIKNRQVVIRKTK